MLPFHERERIEREKREKRGQLEEQHRPVQGQVHHQGAQGGHAGGQQGLGLGVNMGMNMGMGMGMNMGSNMGLMGMGVHGNTPTSGTATPSSRNRLGMLCPVLLFPLFFFFFFSFPPPN